MGCLLLSSVASLTVKTILLCFTGLKGLTGLEVDFFTNYEDHVACRNVLF